MVTVTQKAYRLHNDLGVNWAGIGLAIQLLDEMEQLKSHNQLLQRRLNRFIVD
jgi:chaperone modulatory protein CbpM